MGREQLDHAGGRDPELGAGAAKLSGGDPLFDDAPVRGELREKRAGADRAGRGGQRRHSLRDPRELVGGARDGQAGEVDERVSFARDAVVELDHELREPGLDRS